MKRTKIKIEKEFVEVGGVRLINLTPHEVRLVLGPQTEVIIPPSGTVARVITDTKPLPPVEGIIPLVKTEFGQPFNLPEPENGTIFITSTLVAQVAARQGRTDVVAPDTSPQSAIRDEQGRIIGVTRLQTFAEEVK